MAREPVWWQKSSWHHYRTWPRGQSQDLREEAWELRGFRTSKVNRNATHDGAATSPGQWISSIVPALEAPWWGKQSAHLDKRLGLSLPRWREWRLAQWHRRMCPRVWERSSRRSTTHSPHNNLKKITSRKGMASAIPFFFGKKV